MMKNDLTKELELAKMTLNDFEKSSWNYLAK